MITFFCFSLSFSTRSRSAALSCFFRSCRSLSKASPSLTSPRMPNADFKLAISFALRSAMAWVSFGLRSGGEVLKNSNP